MRPQDMVAIILAVAVLLVLLSTSPILKALVGVTSVDNLGLKALDVMGNLLFAIIGALSGYIVGKNK